MWTKKLYSASLEFKKKIFETNRVLKKTREKLTPAILVTREVIDQGYSVLASINTFQMPPLFDHTIFSSDGTFFIFMNFSIYKGGGIPPPPPPVT